MGEWFTDSGRDDAERAWPYRTVACRAMSPLALERLACRYESLSNLTCLIIKLRGRLHNDYQPDDKLRLCSISDCLFQNAFNLEQVTIYQEVQQAGVDHYQSYGFPIEAHRPLLGALQKYPPQHLRILDICVYPRFDVVGLLNGREHLLEEVTLRWTSDGKLLSDRRKFQRGPDRPASCS